MAVLQYRLPHPDLREYISLYYHLDSSEPMVDEHERAAIAQVRFTLHGKGRMILPTGEEYTDNGAFVVGPTSACTQIETGQDFSLFGVGLLPAGWTVMTNRCAAEHADRVLPAGDIFPNMERHLATLKNCRDIDEMSAAADVVLRPIAAGLKSKITAFTAKVDKWLASEPSPDVHDLHNMFKLSDRQLTRKIKRIYGFPPKYLARKYRALRAARALVDGNTDEADFILDAFYDQPHMIREIKLFAGATPTKLRTDEGDLARLIDKRGAFTGKINALSAKT